jgi:branched-subunit amino acid aminotransferase/4-amino-4-deoxychorismate lyase
LRVPAGTDDCWADGRRVAVSEARLPIDDPAVQAGLGLFETIALRDGCLLELDLHLDRTLAGAARLGLEIPSRDALRANALEAAGDGAPACGWLKIVVTGGGRSFVFRGAMDRDEEGRSATAVLLPWRRNANDPLVGLKTLNYAGNLVGLDLARRQGADEGLWVNTRGHLAEGCTSNLFVVRAGKLFTPGLCEGILPGVVRGLAIAAARRLGCPVHEGKLRLPRLERASEAFLTSSLRGVRPLVRFRGRPVGSGRPGTWTKRIAKEVARARRAGRESTAGTPPSAGR